jgi:hypothetical protein
MRTACIILTLCWPIGMAAGCGSYAGVHGVVNTAGADVHPVDRATVSMNCPGTTTPVFRVETDGSGRFEHRLDEAVSNACELLVEKPGLVPRRFRMLDVCAEGGRGRVDQCSEAVVTAHLGAAQAP